MRIDTEAGQLLHETAVSWGWSEEAGVYALAQAANSLAAAGAGCMGMEVQIMFPPHADHVKIYAMERCIRKTCRERGIELKDTKLVQCPLYAAPAVTVSGIGYLPERAEQTGARAGEEIVQVKWAGMEGMLRILDERGEELSQRFAPVFISQIRSYRDEIFSAEELETAREMKVTAVRQITDGGILAALWKLAKETGMGIEADMKRISILQETIEVCEHYRLNPYQTASAGSFLMLAEDGKVLADALERKQIRASVIGRLTAGNDKLIHNGEDIRYIDRPAPDEISKLFMGGKNDGRDEKSNIKVFGEEQQG